MNTDLYEIYEAAAEISDGLMENRIEFSYDRLMGVMGCHPAHTLERILTKIDWDSRSPDMDKISEALDELIEFNKMANIKELKKPIKELKEYIKTNRVG